MKAERQIPLESSLAKAKQLTDCHYKSRSIQETLALGNSEKLKNCRDKEGCFYSDSKKKRPIEEHLYSVSNKKYMQCFPDKIDSGSEETCEDTSNIDEGRSHMSDKFEVVNSEIPLQQKLSLEKGSAGGDRDDLINEIHKNCDKRMKKLVQKQEHQIQEFNKGWEDKLSKLKEDHILDAAVIRAMYGKGSATESRLMILDDKFAKTVAENKVLKDMQLQDLEAEQLAARNEESHKIASWLSKTEAYISGDRTGCYKTGSLDSQHEKVSGCSESRTNILGAKDVLLLAGQHGVNINSGRAMQGKHVVKSNNSDCETSEEIGCNEGGPSISDILIPTVVEKINQPKHFHDGESIHANLPASVEKVPGEMQLFELHGDGAAELPESVVNEITDIASPMDCSSSSPIKGLVGRDSTIDNLDSSDQVLKISEQTEASPDFHLPLQQVHKSQDMVHSKIQVHVNSSPIETVVSELLDTATNLLSKDVTDSERVDTAASVTDSELIGTAPTLQSNLELQDQVEPAIETQSTSNIEVTGSENMNKTTPAFSSMLLQDEDALIVKDQVNLEIEVSNSELADIATPMQSHIDAPAIQNCEQLLHMPIDESPSCSQLPSIELESQIQNPRIISSGAAEIELPSHGSTSQLKEDMELLSSNLDAGPGTQSSLVTSSNVFASFQDNVDLEIQILHEDILWLSGAIHLPIHEGASWNCPSLFSNPLVNELESISKETEELQRSLENQMSCLKSECERERQERVAEVQNKNELKFDDAETQFRLKENELCKNHNKILMNSLLADTVSCLNCLPTGPILEQGSSLNTQQIQVLPSTRSTQPSPSVQAQHAAAISSFTARPGVNINANHAMTNQAFVPAAPPFVPPAIRNRPQQNWQQQQSLSSSRNRPLLGHPLTPPHTSPSSFGSF